MFTYKNAPYKIFVLGAKFCWAGLVWEAQGQCFWTNIIVNILKVHFFFSFNHSQGKNIKYNENLNKMETNYLVLVG